MIDTGGHNENEQSDRIRGPKYISNHTEKIKKINDKSTLAENIDTTLWLEHVKIISECYSMKNLYSTDWSENENPPKSWTPGDNHCL
jgi:hypothetical protein